MPEKRRNLQLFYLLTRLSFLLKWRL